MLDRFNRKIDYLRISLTDKCNLACFYCKPEKNEFTSKKEGSLKIEQLEKIIKEAADLGITKVRFTGGEPLLYKGIEELIQRVQKINKISEITLTTNGTFLSSKAKTLKDAGLTRVNISLDSLDSQKYSQITRGGDIQAVFKGVDSAVEHNLAVKINMVVIKGVNDNEIGLMQEFCKQKNIGIQLIKHFDLNSQKDNDCTYDRPPKCEECNRIRLLSGGILKPCLHSEIEYKLNMANIQASLVETISNKPKNGLVCKNRKMVEIGG